MTSRAPGGSDVRQGRAGGEGPLVSGWPDGLWGIRAGPGPHEDAVPGAWCPTAEPDSRWLHQEAELGLGPVHPLSPGCSAQAEAFLQVNLRCDPPPARIRGGLTMAGPSSSLSLCFPIRSPLSCSRR